jgi:hypothetical protein
MVLLFPWKGRFSGTGGETGRMHAWTLLIDGTFFYSFVQMGNTTLLILKCLSFVWYKFLALEPFRYGHHLEVCETTSALVTHD